MKIWRDDFPHYKKLTAYLLFRKAHNDYFDRLKYGFDKKTGKWGFIRKLGYRGRIAGLTNKHKGKRCFVIANGPGLTKLDLNKLKGEVTIGSNGVFELFDELGFKLKYYTMEDLNQIEDRIKQLPKVVGSTRLFPLRSSYCIPKRKDTIFFNLECDSYPYHWRYKDKYPLFSEDFASTVYLGSTVTYINLQLAFHLGCDPVYIIGLDHSYGKLSELLPPGKVRITPEIFEMIKSCHFKEGYHKIGGEIGVPYVKEQEKAYRKADEMYRVSGRRLFNASYDTQCDIFDRVDYEDIFR